MRWSSAILVVSAFQMNFIVYLMWSFDHVFYYIQAWFKLCGLVSHPLSFAGEECWQLPRHDETQGTGSNKVTIKVEISVRKQLTFCNTKMHWFQFPAKWCLRNKGGNSILMTQHCPDLVNASECMRQIFNQSEDLGSDASLVWEFCASCSDVILKGLTSGLTDWCSFILWPLFFQT